MVEIIWHGHACFEVRGKEATVVTDPFKGVGLPEPKAQADIVLCSHSHGDHNNAGPVKKSTGVVLEGFVGSRKVGPVEVTGIGLYHDDAKGGKRGKNSTYVFTVDGVKFCHVGDLGHDLSASEVGAIGKIDALFVPVGGYYTIGPAEAWSVCQKLKPSLIFPMHYRMAGMSATFDNLSTIDDFLRGKPNVKRVGGKSYSATKEGLPKQTEIVVLSLK